MKGAGEGELGGRSILTVLSSLATQCKPFGHWFSLDFLGSCANVREIRFEATFAFIW